jgi:hypothetical protein
LKGIKKGTELFFGAVANKDIVNSVWGILVANKLSEAEITSAVAGLAG